MQFTYPAFFGDKSASDDLLHLLYVFIHDHDSINIAMELPRILLSDTVFRTDWIRDQVARATSNPRIAP